MIAYQRLFVVAVFVDDLQHVVVETFLKEVGVGAAWVSQCVHCIVVQSRRVTYAVV
jgi:hypothetical protein